MSTCVHFSRSLPSNSWWQTMVGWQVLSRPSAAEGGGRRPAFTGPATQPYSATEVDGWNSSAGCLKTGPQYTSGKYHKSVETVLRNAEANLARETNEYLQHRRMRDTLREAILKVMADDTLDALAYPSIRVKPNLIGEAQLGNNCRLSSNSGLPAIAVPGGFTPDGLPIGVELLGRAWSEPLLIKFAYAYEQATHHRRPPVSTPSLDR